MLSHKTLALEKMTHERVNTASTWPSVGLNQSLTELLRQVQEQSRNLRHFTSPSVTEKDWSWSNNISACKHSV